jgi:hypothetical protein
LERYRKHHQEGAVTALNLAGQPIAATILGSTYSIVNNVEDVMAESPGQTKLQMAQNAISGSALPALKIGLLASGKHFDEEKMSPVVTRCINAAVAENNAQAALNKLLSDATASGTPVDLEKLKSAQHAISEATALVIQSGTEISALIQDIQNT